MNYYEWLKTYKPQENHLTTDSPFNNSMYETFGEEYEHITNQDVHNVWTLLDDSKGGLVIVPGVWWVNRLGYFVCENKWKNNDKFEGIHI